jgi:hypothetical protein
MSRRIILFVLGAALASLSCGGTDEPEPPVIRMTVEAPSDGSCIGVSGFEIDVVVANAQPIQSFVDRTRPVLARDECVLERPSAFGSIDLDAAVRVEVRGYDGAKQLRVRGVASFVSLRDQESVTLQLEPAGVSGLMVVAIDRNQDLLFGSPLDAVASIELSVPGQSQLVVNVDDEVRPYFVVGEPWAVAFSADLVVGDDLSAKVTLLPSGVIAKKLVVEASESGEYLRAVSP